MKQEKKHRIDKRKFVSIGRPLTSMFESTKDPHEFILFILFYLSTDFKPIKNLINVYDLLIPVTYKR